MFVWISKRHQKAIKFHVGLHFSQNMLPSTSSLPFQNGDWDMLFFLQSSYFLFLKLCPFLYIWNQWCFQILSWKSPGAAMVFHSLSSNFRVFFAFTAAKSIINVNTNSNPTVTSRPASIITKHLNYNVSTL